MSPNPLRNLPSVHELMENPALKGLVERISHNALVSTARTVLEEVRNEVQTVATDRTLPSIGDLAERVARRIAEGQPLVLQPVINATGTLLHAGLGRSPLAEEAIVETAAVARDYVNLDLDLSTGRHWHRNAVIEGLLCELTGAEAALVVNNNAGAAVLTLAALATGHEVIVSRGQLLEIGDGYRLPELIAVSGATLREIGATNTTRLNDYTEAIGEQTSALMLVHPSNFVVVDSTETVALEDLVGIGRQHKLLVIHDIGSGALIDFRRFGFQDEPVARQSIKAGADVVLFSGDKLLGGPQCGIIAGRKALIEKIEHHPMARALRIGKLTLAALAGTLRLYRDPGRACHGIPILQLLSTSVENLKNRAERLAPQAAATAAVREAKAVADTSRLNGKHTPAREVPTWCIALKPAVMRSTSSPPLCARESPL